MQRDNDLFDVLRQPRLLGTENRPSGCTFTRWSRCCWKGPRW